MHHALKGLVVDVDSFQTLLLLCESILSTKFLLYHFPSRKCRSLKHCCIVVTLFLHRGKLKRELSFTIVEKETMLGETIL